MENPSGYVYIYPSVQYPFSVPILWAQECPGCKTICSPSLHDFSLCTQLRNAEYRIRELEKRVAEIIQGIEQEKSARQAAMGIVPRDERGVRQDYSVPKETCVVQSTSW